MKICLVRQICEAAFFNFTTLQNTLTGICVCFESVYYTMIKVIINAYQYANGCLNKLIKKKKKHCLAPILNASSLRCFSACAILAVYPVSCKVPEKNC